MPAMSQLLEPAVRRTPLRWTKDEYHKATGRGWFDGRRVYLYRGELIQMPAMGGLHARGVVRLTYWLTETFRPEWEVRLQLPFECVDESEPEPDGAVLTSVQQARQPHPNSAAMLFEISDSSIELDREMAFDYAAAGVPEYWIINVRDRQIEVYRNPVADPRSMTGWRYAEVAVRAAGESISPLLDPGVSVEVNLLADVG
jgi:Uma2 family endonuclease